MANILIVNESGDTSVTVNPNTIIMNDQDSQVRLKGINQSNYKRILEDLKYYVENDESPEDKFPPILVSKNKDGKLEIVDGNHRLKAFLEEEIPLIRVVEVAYSSEHEKIKEQVGKNLHPTSTALNRKKDRAHALKSYMSALDKDKSIKKGSYEYPLKSFAKKVKNDQEKAFSDATPLVEEMFSCPAESAKSALEDAIVFDDPKQKSWSRKDLLNSDEANSVFGISKASAKKPDNCYVVIPVFHSGYLWSNAIGTAYKAKTIYKCKTILRIADDGRADHLDTFRKTIVNEVQKINKSGILGRGKALFDEIQIAPQKTGYENESLKEEGFFSVKDKNELEEGKRADFDVKSIPYDGWTI